MIAMTEPTQKPRNPSGEQVSLTRNERIAIIVFFAAALIYTGWQFFVRSDVEVNLGQDIPGGLVVDVEGAVRSPGNVYLPAGSTIHDAVDAAGGFTENADSESLNLNDTVVDGQRIIIPTLGEPVSRRNTGGGQIVGNQPRINDEPYSGLTPVTVSGFAIVNINTANIYELQELPGIGEGLAQRIIDYRRAHGRFENIEDIMNVDGIGDQRFIDIKNFIVVEDH